MIAHELAHMWYGDLVTMAWWDDLWLNEAFATWMAFHVVDDWKPEWHMWHDFEHDRAAALALDALANTHPIYARGAQRRARRPRTSTLITYEKGASVVRMIEHYLGADDVPRRRAALHAAPSRGQRRRGRPLARARARRRARDVARVAQAWIEQPGFPLVTLSAGRDGAALRVRQERFFADPQRRRRRAAARAGRCRWSCKSAARRRRRGDARARVTSATQTRRARRRGRAGVVYGNADAGGFYRVLHDAGDRGGARSRRSPRRSTPVERLALVGDQWALVRAGRAPIESFLDLADALGDETDHDVLDGARRRRSPCSTSRSPTPGSAGAGGAPRRGSRDASGRRSRGSAGTARRDEADDVRLRRAALLRLVGRRRRGRRRCWREARRRFDALPRATASALEPNLADPVVGARGARRRRRALRALPRAWSREARTPQERRRFLLALGAFRDAARSSQRTLARCSRRRSRRRTSRSC